MRSYTINTLSNKYIFFKKKNSVKIVYDAYKKTLFKLMNLFNFNTKYFKT